MPSTEEVQVRRADTSERFVAFAFAGADLVVETTMCGCIVYAAGAYRSLFGERAEAFLGRPVHALIAPADQETLDWALLMLTERGRLPPMLIRMADPERTQLSMAGIAVPTEGRAERLCITLGRPPVPVSTAIKSHTPESFARRTEARLRAGEICGIGLLEITARDGVSLAEGEAIGLALESVAPDAVASLLSPGRYGVLGPDGAAMERLTDTKALQQILRSQGIEATVTSNLLSTSAEGLTPPQAARALRQALAVFTREGSHGLVQAGLGQSLSLYLQQAGRKAESLRRAIRNGNFKLLFQPIVTLEDRRVHHYEALIRPSPIDDLPLANPQEFVMLVEALGLAGELDLAVARQACNAAGRSGAVVAFNLSGQSVQNPAFREQLTVLLGESLACKAGLVIVEMTETAEIESMAEACATAETLRRLGIPFCLDDFGAGSTDMQLLRALNANIVKLDGSYLAGIATAGRERAFIAGMVDIARAVGADVVAERIETEAECLALQNLGVTYGQGWLFGHPGPLPRANGPHSPR